MNDNEIIALINTTLTDEFEIPAEKLLPQASVRDDLEMDSLDIVDMVVALENAFAFKLSDREAIRNIRTLGDIHAFIIGLRDAGVVKR